MCMPKRFAVVALCLTPGVALGETLPIPAQDYGIGTPATDAQMQAWDITVRPDGENLPEGSGTPALGKQVYDQQCAACHGDAGQGGVGPRLVGDIGSLTTANPIKDVGSYWPYATTLFDYIRRAMPFPSPQSLTADQVYAVSAYILQMNGIIPDSAIMDRKSLPMVTMPNRDGFLSMIKNFDTEK
jgi:S-disulfanyl-L-cysteine oxidoreductase SoxD